MSIKKRTMRISEFNKGAGHKINMGKTTQVVFLSSCNEQPKDKTKKIILFITCPKDKILSNNFNEEV